MMVVVLCVVLMGLFDGGVVDLYDCLLLFGCVVLLLLCCVLVVVLIRCVVC